MASVVCISITNLGKAILYSNCMLYPEIRYNKELHSRDKEHFATRPITLMIA